MNKWLSGLIAIGMLKLLVADTARLQGLLTDALGVALILTALGLLFKDRLITSMAQGRIASSGMQRWREPTTTLAGVVLGALVTLTSVGARALGAVMLFLLYPRLPAAHIVGTDLSYAVPLAMLAGLRHFYFWERWMRHCYALPAWNLARLPYWDRNSEAGAATDSGEHIGFNWGQIDLIW